MTDEELRGKVAAARLERLGSEMLNALDDADTPEESRRVLTAWEMGMAAGDLLRWRGNALDAGHRREVALIDLHKAEVELSKVEGELSRAEGWLAVADAWHADVLVRVAELGGVMSEGAVRWLRDRPGEDEYVVEHIDAAGSVVERVA